LAAKCWNLLVLESGAGKSTLGSHGVLTAQAGCRISSALIMFDSIDLVATDDENALWGSRIACATPSAPPHRLTRPPVD
jgi:ABC-type glutathione transport system ATPase component